MNDEDETKEQGVVGGTETILLVDDEDVVLETGQETLEHLGYTVLTARDGDEALQTYRDHQDKIALVLTDTVMPKMGGGLLYTMLMEINPSVKILLMSGYSLKEKMANLPIRNVKGFIQKPLELFNLGQTVRQILDE